jgi:hypothetical protein
MNAQLLSGTTGFLRPDVGEGIAGGHTCMFPNTFASVGGDQQVDVVTLAGVTSQQRSDDSLIIRVREHGHQTPPGLLRFERS